jgi:hypothetical protein
MREQFTLAWQTRMHMCNVILSKQALETLYGVVVGVQQWGASEKILKAHCCFLPAWLSGLGVPDDVP